MSRPVPIRLRKRLSSPSGLGPNIPRLPPLAVNNLSRTATSGANDTVSRIDSAIALKVAVAGATDTISRTDATAATSIFVATATDTITRVDAASSISNRVSAATDTLSRSDSAVAANTPPVQFPTISGADPVRRRRKDEREDLLEVIRALSPTPDVADRVEKAVQRSTMAKRVAPAGIALHPQVLALPESLRAIVRQAIKQVEDREQEEFLLLL